MTKEKEQNKGNNANFNTPYDDAHQTMVTECPALLIPVVNEVFHKNYSRNEKVTLSNRNFMANLASKEQQKRITDSVFSIQMEDYLMECQSTADGTIIMRIFEYSTQEALEKAVLKDNTLTVRFPNAAIIYLRHNAKTPNEMTICIKVPNRECSYQVPVVKVQNYSVEQLFEKELFFFIPFHIFTYEKDFFEYEKDEDKLRKLKVVYGDIVERLDVCARGGRLTEFEKKTVVEMANKVLEKIAIKYSKVKEEVGNVMGGKVLDYEAKDILNQGRQEGRQEGETRLSKLITILLNANMTQEIALVTSNAEIREEYYAKYNI